MENKATPNSATISFPADQAGRELVNVAMPSAGQSETVVVIPGVLYQLGVDKVVFSQQDTNLVAKTADGGELVFQDYFTFASTDLPPALSLNNGVVIPPQQIMAELGTGDLNAIEPAAGGAAVGGGRGGGLYTSYAPGDIGTGLGVLDLLGDLDLAGAASSVEGVPGGGPGVVGGQGAGLAGATPSVEGAPGGGPGGINEQGADLAGGTLSVSLVSLTTAVEDVPGGVPGGISSGLFEDNRPNAHIGDSTSARAELNIVFTPADDEFVTRTEVTGFPVGTVLTLSDGTVIEITTPGQLVTLAPGLQLGIQVSPPANGDADFTLTTTVFIEDDSTGVTTASITATTTVVVDAVADTPTATSSVVVGVSVDAGLSVSQNVLNWAEAGIKVSAVVALFPSAITGANTQGLPSSSPSTLVKTHESGYPAGFGVSSNSDDTNAREIDSLKGHGTDTLSEAVRLTFDVPQSSVTLSLSLLFGGEGSPYETDSKESATVYAFDGDGHLVAVQTVLGESDGTVSVTLASSSANIAQIFVVPTYNPGNYSDFILSGVTLNGSGVVETHTVTVTASSTFGDVLDGSESHYILVQVPDSWNAAEVTVTNDDGSVIYSGSAVSVVTITGGSDGHGGTYAGVADGTYVKVAVDDQLGASSDTATIKVTLTTANISGTETSADDSTIVADGNAAATTYALNTYGLAVERPSDDEISTVNNVAASSASVVIVTVLDSAPVEDDPGSTPVAADPGSTPVEDDPGSTPVEDDPGSTPVEDDPGSTPVADDPGSTYSIGFKAAVADTAPYSSSRPDAVSKIVVTISGLKEDPGEVVLYNGRTRLDVGDVFQDENGVLLQVDPFDPYSASDGAVALTLTPVVWTSGGYVPTTLSAPQVASVDLSNLGIKLPSQPDDDFHVMVEVTSSTSRPPSFQGNFDNSDGYSLTVAVPTGWVVANAIGWTMNLNSMGYAYFSKEESDQHSWRTHSPEGSVFWSASANSDADASVTATSTGATTFGDVVVDGDSDHWSLTFDDHTAYSGTVQLSTIDGDKDTDSVSFLTKSLAAGDTGNLTGTSGNDILIGNDLANVIHGGDGNDGIYGLCGDDVLYGESGNDVLAGGAGDDVLTGGTDVDAAGKITAGHDTITDFDIGEGDKIDLDALFNALDAGGVQNLAVKVTESDSTHFTVGLVDATTGPAAHSEFSIAVETLGSTTVHDVAQQISTGSDLHPKV